ncbi:MAG: phosphoribosylamine--glycine ligase [Candidatus Paceibacterota bacterium]|jgi:phosphoribosylamine--glycine ligase
MNNNKQKILIIGGGGREHAIGWKIRQSGRCGELYFAPGNGGTADLGMNVDIKATDIQALIEFVKKEKIDLTLAIPDDPLALGIVDLFQKEGLRIFGPTQKAAELESSKAFSKQFMKRNNLPTAEFEVFSNFDQAKKYIEGKSMPIVVKASGLALGKGVIIAQNKDEAIKALEDILVKKVFGEAGNEVVIEEFLVGPEISIHAFSDGISYKMFPSSQDHKKIGENDTGLNTGGMGTIAPLPRLIGGQAFITDELMAQIEKEIVAPTLQAMRDEGMPYKGILYPGLILTKDGPKILEYNARFGDPETQTYMRLLDTDLLDIIDACIDEKLSQIEINWKQLSACTIVLASGGYPENYEKNKIISGIDSSTPSLRATPQEGNDIVVFQAGTKYDDKGNLITNGGRVLGVSATGDTLDKALESAYKVVEKISFDEMYYRKDIGKKALAIRM